MRRQGLVILLHALALVALLGGILRATGIPQGGYYERELLKSSILSQYLLWAILFEIAAINAKKY